MRSQLFTVQVIVLTMVEDKKAEAGIFDLIREYSSSRLSLTSRILAVNILPLLFLGGGIFYLDTYRTQLLNERYKLARIEAQITAEALAGATRARQEALLIQIGKEQRMRLRIFNPEGVLSADSFALDDPSFELTFDENKTPTEQLAMVLDEALDAIVGAAPVPDYYEPENSSADAWPELRRAREEGISQIQLREAPDGTPVINAAAPLGIQGSTLLTTRNAVDITESVRAARSFLGLAVLLVLFASILLSLFLARTIIAPIKLLSHSTSRVRQGRDRGVEVPRLPQRFDEIGNLARSISDMTSALRQRIDAVDSFAADVAHEIKNPLASLRSALESLSRVQDPELRNQLINLSTHDVRRIDRLVTEISDASRIDSELSRAKREKINMILLTKAVIDSRESRDKNAGSRIEITTTAKEAYVIGVESRLERVLENLLDNAASFSPSDAPILVDISERKGTITITISDFGPGIPAEAMEKVFERFHSVRPEADGFGNHSGLGLAIARAIAEAHDGSLIAEKRPDGLTGARLRLDLPVAE